MAVKVFAGIPTFNGYGGSPVDHFSLSIPIQMFNSDGPGAEGDAVTLDLPLGSTPLEVYAEVYAQIVDKVEALSWPAPAKSDVFGFVPMSVATILPDQPSFV